MAGTLLPTQTETSHVQELAIHGKEPPLRYIHIDGYTKASSPLSIPIIDLRCILSESASIKEKEQEMDKLRSALTSWGLFQAIGHGMSNSLLDEVRNIGKEFFNLPMEEKKKYSLIPVANERDDQQGYGNDRICSEEQKLDWSDRLFLLVKPQEKRKVNIWPEDPKRFREVLDEYSIETTLLADKMLKAMEKMMGLEEDCFLRQFGEEASIYARFNYYPPCSKPNLVYGLKPHTDGGGVTIALPDKEVEGLQVLKDGEWIKVPVSPYALVISIGDQMEIMSNGNFKSPLHRVVPSSEKERISVAMFYSLNFDKEIEPAEGLIDATRPRLFKKMKVIEYLKIFMEKFSQGKKAIDYAKI